MQKLHTDILKCQPNFKVTLYFMQIQKGVPLRKFLTTFFWKKIRLIFFPQNIDKIYPKIHRNLS